MAAAQTVAVVEAGGRTVSLGDLLGPEFAASPETMFAADRFHPSAMGYRAATAALLPSVIAAAGGTAPSHVPAAGERGRSLAQAAARAPVDARAAGRGPPAAGPGRGR